MGVQIREAIQWTVSSAECRHLGQLHQHRTNHRDASVWKLTAIKSQDYSKVTFNLDFDVFYRFNSGSNTLLTFIAYCISVLSCVIGALGLQIHDDDSRSSFSLLSLREVQETHSSMNAEHGWRFGVAVTRWSRSTRSTSSPVSNGMGDCLRAGKLSHYVTSHPGQLSLSSFRGR